VTLVGGKNLDGIWFDTWSRLSKIRVVYHFSLVVWHVGCSSGLVERQDHKICCVAYFQLCGWTSDDL
jgi:hypothetical protein